MLIQGRLRGHAIIPHHRVGQDQDLPLVGRVGECFRVAHHAGVEDDFPCHGDIGAKGEALVDGAIDEHEGARVTVSDEGKFDALVAVELCACVCVCVCVCFGVSE